MIIRDKTTLPNMQIGFMSKPIKVMEVLFLPVLHENITSAYGYPLQVHVCASLRRGSFNG